MDLSERTLNIQQAMAVAGVSRRTIYNWIAAGKLTYRRTAGGSLRILESSLWQPDESTRLTTDPRHINA
jgi:excisionase family DNA binding protein